MEPFRHILVAVDVDANGEIAFGCRAAVAQSLWLAQRNRARITFVHVSTADEVRDIADMQPQSPITAQLARSRRLLESLATTAPDGSGHARMLHGDTAREIVTEVTRGDTDLLVIGTRERGSLGRALFGSTAGALLRGCPCPVWAVKPQQQAGFSRVMVAHDLRSSGDAALALGASLALRQDAELHVLHVIENPLNGMAREDIDSARSRFAGRLMDECRKLGVADRAYVAVRNGVAHEEILDYATAQAIDLLCMGTHARTGLARLIAGNTAEKVLPAICCSLLAIRPEGSKALRELAS